MFMTDMDEQIHDSLREWYSRTCLATAYLPATGGEDATQVRETAIERISGDVTEQAGEDAATRLAKVMGAHANDHGVVGVVGEDDAEAWTVAGDLTERVHPGPLPALARLVAARQTWIPHAVVLIDKIGADIDIVTATGDHARASIDGATSHITKSNPGGWSQKRFQTRAEEHWHDNAELVAERLTTEVDRNDIDLVLITGNDEMISILRDELPQRIAEMLVDLKTGGRAEDGSRELVEQAVDEAVRAEAEARRVESGEKVTTAIARSVGASGRTEVLQALFEGRVDHLLIETDSTEGLIAHIGAEPTQVAADSSVLHDLGLDATRVPLVDAAIRAALASGADITVVRKALAELTDGLGASLRG